MTAAAPRSKPRLADDFDPDAFRMSVGDHLEELRGRLIFALAGAALGFVLCLVFARGYVLPFFCRPLVDALLENDVNPQTYFRTVTGPFVIYLKVAAIGGLVLASPWVLWQFWQFVASGLYPRERRAVTRYIPLSLTLLLGGMAMAYYVMLPLTLQFFISFGLSIPMPMEISPTAEPPAGVVLPQVPILDADPATPAEGGLWFNRTESRLKYHDGGRAWVMQFAPETLAAPLIELPEYVNLVMLMLLVFGVSFQLPLAVLGVTAAGLVEPADLAANRKFVIFGLAILSAVITPADPLSMIALAVPLALLFELGIFLAGRGAARRAADDMV